MRKMNSALNEYYFLRLLRFGHFVRRPSGGWRFGTRVISDVVVDRLIARGQAVIVGDRLQLKSEPAHRSCGSITNESNPDAGALRQGLCISTSS
jgi:hypothetical protein